MTVLKIVAGVVAFNMALAGWLIVEHAVFQWRERRAVRRFEAQGRERVGI